MGGCFRCNGDGERLQPITRRRQLDLPRLPGLAPHYHKAKSVEGFPRWGLKWLKARRITVIRSGNFARTFEVEMNLIAGARRHQARLVRHRQSHESQVAAVGANHGTIGCKRELGGFPCGFGFGGCPHFPVLVSDDFELARLIHDVVPAQAIFVRRLRFSPERFAVEK
jgi:hypothetical protein